MITVVKATGSSVAAPSLVFVHQSAGVLADVAALSFQILDGARAQVFPVTPGNKEPVNVSTAKLGKGRFAATWDASARAAGQHYVKWFYRTTLAAPELSFEQEFELVEVPYVGANYCTLYDLRSEGFSISGYSDAQLQKRISLVSAMIDRYTQRRFDPAYKTIRVDGRNSRAILFEEPIVAVDTVTVLSPFEDIEDALPFKVFNRHLSQGLVQEDDRANPKIEINEGVWPKGTQNVIVAGVFGYTEPDGSFVGKTPQLIRWACQLMVAKNPGTLASSGGSGGGSEGPIKRIKTREQEIEYHADSRFSAFTGDAETDSILIAFRRPPIFEAA